MNVERIRTLEELSAAARDKRAVYCKHRPRGSWSGMPRPAAFVINYTGSQLLRMIQDGLYVYERQPKRPRSFRKPIPF